MRKRNVLLLSLSQALAMSAPPMIILLAGIIGADIAPSDELATLPISLMVVGMALTTIPAALLMQKIGRRRGFMGAAIGAGLAALLAAYAVAQGSYVLFCAATLLMGANGAFVQQYRFAAAESVEPQHAGKAVSFLLLGGIAAGYLGPEVAQRTQDWLPTGLYTGSFVSLALMYAGATGLLYFLRDVAPPDPTTLEGEHPLKDIILRPAYLVAVLSGAVAYGVMSFTMTATPVYLNRIHGYSIAQTAWIIQSHVIAMYVPSLFTGFIVERLGVLRVMGLGVLGLLVSAALGVASRELIHFWGTLVLLGVGWNFLFVGATVLLTRSYTPAERFKAQATNDFIIFGIQAFTSLSAGTVLFRANWDILNLLNLPFLVLVLAALLLLNRQGALRPSEA